MAAIFLSYSRADRPKAQVFAEALTAEGFSVWWDKVLRAGQTYDEVTEGMLRDADVVVVLWSAVSVKSKWVRTEATLGQRTSVLVPAMIEDAERPIMFELTQSADLIGWDGDRSDVRWQEFVADIRRAAEQAAASDSKPAPVPPPAPGQAADMTMELTFWTSVKDSDDKADFEAYLKRYPDGHYSDLARNRIAAIARAHARAAAPPPAPPPQAPPPPPPPPPRAAAPAPAPKPAPAPPKPAPAKPVAAASAPPKKSGSSLPLVLGGLVAIVLAGWVIANLIPSDDTAADDAALTADAADAPAAPEAPALPEPEVIETAATETAAPAVDVPAEPEPEPEPVAPVCDVCPAMVSLPGGTFSMGSPATESGREPIEGPVHDVTVKPFAISKTEITAAQWAACLADGGCNGYRPPAGESDGLPATAISWRDATAYTKWLSAKEGRTYRLPTEAEWEYAARGGTSTAYWWGERFDSMKAPRDRLREAASLPENTFGLQGMLGNLREWVEDCYVNGYSDTPTDGSAVLSGDCGRRVVRGGSIKSGQAEHRAANRARISVTTRDRQIGFRVVREED
ncbi:SUMF1/EgtB/PvdO family nonheme iron enzyme [Hyphomonas sp.]|uniref:SUMF1/EgtB/PvdO family nonheme iron enzyme n=1 Tax=Hyphomonas sp. TaxID=87 RepID=UPI0025B9EFB4|nr:SUMF1/EgtB/PvdO family nonheme iron enzyme [Hyphomonas sp.]MBI1399964.1 SUMF1/EgtB/PvdO family nonheme iron enzyme [Hyphomonas sp.]